MSTDATPSGGGFARLGDAMITVGDSELLRTILDGSPRALAQMYRPDVREFVQTVRRDPARPEELRQEGTNERYAAIVGLGAARLDADRQRALLAGITADELVESLAGRVGGSPDLGVVALATWASGEVRRSAPDALVDRLATAVRGARMQDTVSYAWTVTALLAVRDLAEVSVLTEQAAERLMAAQEPSGLFPHTLPKETQGRFRSHVACFADEVYPVQALARYWRATGDRRALEAANRCARVLVDRQGAAGQWWWHYDVRTRAVVEGYPVYSVHQHAMAPMALFDLQEAGGDDHRAAAVAGLRWLQVRPETDAELLDGTTGAIWRKVGRREPRKLVRSARAVATAVSPGARLGLLDRACPPTVVDHECRPYELGWLLYAWLPTRTDDERDLVATRSNRADARS